MLDFLHDIHLIVHLLVEDAIFHEPSLLEFLGSKWNTIELGCDLVHGRECTLADSSDFVIFGAASPFSKKPAHIRGGWVWSANIGSCKDVRL